MDSRWYVKQYHQHRQADVHQFTSLWALKPHKEDIIMDKQEPNDSMHSSGEQKRTLGRGYLDSPMQRRNWVLLMLVVIFVVVRSFPTIDEALG
jgi:hypothetical protein